MSKYSRPFHPAFNGSRITETVLEVGMTVAAAGLTAIIWLGVGAWAVLPAATAETTETASVQAPTQVTLPTVVIVGRREIEGTPVTTTAQNTAAIPVTLR